ncbi:MAG: hydrogenase nickel incorporation protein HypB [Actinomycetes bacterium]
MATPRIVDLRRGVLEKNDVLAADLRDRYRAAGVRVSNWVSSPGSGKTALLARVLDHTATLGVAAAALVGDCASDNDAKRLAVTGVPVRQIVTEGLCHLEADLVAKHLDGWDLAALDMLVIENVGNLVCPTAYDLGEAMRVVLLSVTEGEDKPIKYPQLFSSADLVVLTKIDLSDAVEFDAAAAMAAIASVNPTAPVLSTSARTGLCVDELIDHLLEAHAPGDGS